MQKDIDLFDSLLRKVAADWCPIKVSTQSVKKMEDSLFEKIRNMEPMTDGGIGDEFDFLDDDIMDF